MYCGFNIRAVLLYLGVGEGQADLSFAYHLSPMEPYFSGVSPFGSLKPSFSPFLKNFPNAVLNIRTYVRTYMHIHKRRTR